jgi:hypothetical protein
MFARWHTFSFVLGAAVLISGASTSAQQPTAIYAGAAVAGFNHMQAQSYGSPAPGLATPTFSAVQLSPWTPAYPAPPVYAEPAAAVAQPAWSAPAPIQARPAYYDNYYRRYGAYRRR